MLGVGLLLQIVTFTLTHDSFFSFFSGIMGVFAVVFCSERKMSYYVFSIIQMATFFTICLQENLYAKLFEQVFYLITTVFGIVIWKCNLDIDKLVNPKKLETKTLIGILLACFGLSVTVGCILSDYNSSQPFLDSTTTVYALAAQILMMLRYRENWILWFIVDILCIWLFVNQQNWCMTMQYVFWSANTVYGFILWKNFEKK